MKIKRLLLLALCLVMALTSVVLPTALTVEASEPSADYSEYDYSNSNSQFNHTVTAAELIEYVMRKRAGSENFTVSDAERAYLEKYSDFKINYDRVLRDYITVDSIESNNVKISAEAYTYTAANGETVTWKPLKAYIVDENGDVVSTVTEFEIASNVYIAAFNGVTVNENTYSYRVEYEIEDGIAVDKNDVNHILNLAFDFVNGENGIKAPLDFYASNEAAIKEYYAYLAEKQTYDQEKAEYDAYLAAYAKYEQDLENYQNYEENLEKYQQIKDSNAKKEAEYNAAVEKYNVYLANLAIAEKQLANFDVALMTTLTYLERQLYACLFSPLVDEVVGRKEELVAVRPKLEDPIADCATASAAIQKIFRPSDGKRYDNLTTTEEKYTFYVNNYEALCKNILLLGESLYKIYTTSGIRALMHTAPEVLGRPDYTEKLSIFIGQLLCLSDALHDKEMSYTDGSGKSHKLSEIKFSYWNQAGTEIKNISITNMFENKAYVKDNNDAKPISLATVSKPVEPQYEELPPEPDTLLKPQEPTPVQHPGIDPALRNPVADPTIGKNLPEFDWAQFLNDENYRKILTDVYNEFSNAASRTEATENVVFAPTITLERPFKAVYVDVTFYDNDGNKITEKRVEKGSSVAFDKQLPTKSEDVTATYTFGKWVTADGTPYDLYSVSESVSLYPEFVPSYKPYTIDSGRLVLESTDELERLPIAHYAEVMRQKNLSTLRITAANTTVIVRYKNLTKLKDAGVTELDFDIISVSNTEYSCLVSAYNSAGNEIKVPTTVEVYMPCLNTDATVNIKDANNSKIDICGGHIISANYFNAEIGQLNKLSIGYTIRNSYRDLVSIQKLAAEGETVEFTVDVPAGMKADVYYVLNSTEYPITGNSFVMPKGNIRIGVNLTTILYTVKFESDGKVIFEKTDYKYGDSLEIPNNPTKVNDDKYSYKFIGWSPEISDRVTGSVTYVAQFEQTLLPVQAKKINWLRVAVVAVVTLFFVGIAALVILILDKKKVISVKGIILAVVGFVKSKKGSAEEQNDSSKNDDSSGDVTPEAEVTGDAVLKNGENEGIEISDAENEEKTVSEAEDSNTAKE